MTYFDFSTVQNCPVKKQSILYTNGSITEKWNNKSHNHSSLGKSQLFLHKFLDFNKRRKLQPNVVNQVTINIKSGKSSRKIYKEVVIAAINPLNNFEVPS